MLKEFKKFVLRGNVVDMSVGIIIGGAFGKIVSSLVNDVLMPPIGLLLGGVDFSSLYINLSGKHYSSLQAATEAGAATINYGVFINSILNFFIISAAIFIVIKAINKLHKKAKEEPPQPSAQEVLLAEIRDLLKR